MGVQDAEKFTEHDHRRPSVYARHESFGGRIPERCKWDMDILHTQLPHESRDGQLRSELRGALLLEGW